MTLLTPSRFLLILASRGRGGAEEYALAIIEEARARSCEVWVAFPLVAATASLRDDLEALGARHVQLDVSTPPPHRGRQQALQAIRESVATARIVRRLRPAKVEIVLPWHDRGFGAVLACGMLRIPTAVVFQLMPAVVVIPWWRRVALAIARRRRQRWISISEQNRRCIGPTFGISQSAIPVINNGIDLDRHAPGNVTAARRAVRDELELPEESILAVAVGRLDEQKGHRDAILALAEIRHSFAVHLAIVGSGPLKSELRALARTSGVGGSVTFLGYRSHVGKYLDAADLFLFPSRWEGLGIALLEAMRHGVALVVSDAGPLPEVVTDGVHARLHRAGDWESLAAALTWALNHPEQMAAMAARAQMRVRDFSRQQMADRTFAVLDQVADPIRKPR